MAFASIKAAAKAGKDFEPIPAGVHVAVCTQVIDLGFQEGFSSKYGAKRKVYLKFEIPGVTVSWEKNGQPMSGPGTIGREFGLSISEKSHVRPFLVGWRGKEFTPAEEAGFEITSVIGKVCQLNVVHETGKDGKKVYANIAAAFPLVQLQRDDIKANPAKYKPSQPVLVYSPDAHDQAIYDQLPEWIRKKIDTRVADPSAKEDDGAGFTGADDSVPPGEDSEFGHPPLDF